MSKSHLPYPGRNESFQSWDFRCKQWERGRYSNQSQGLSGKPNAQGVRELNPTGEHYCSRTNNNFPLAVRVGFGYRAMRSVERWAMQNGYDFAQFSGNMASGMCERIDGVAYKGEKYFARIAVYNNDNH